MKKTVLTNPVSTQFESDRIPVFHTFHYINSDYSQKHSVFSHIHEDYMEIYFVSKGHGRYMVNSKYYNLNEGDIVLCNAGILHGESPVNKEELPTESYSIGIRNLKIIGLPENALCSNDSDPIIPSGALKKQIQELFTLIYMLSIAPDQTKETLNSITVSLLLLVRQMFISKEKSCTSASLNTSALTAERVRKYLDRHYRENPTLDVVSDSLHVSKFYLAHAFRDEYGISPMKYIMQRKIGEAQGLLTDTDISIGEITDYLGFSNVSHLTSMFKQYVGISPAKYRKSRKGLNPGEKFV